MMARVHLACCLLLVASAGSCARAAAEGKTEPLRVLIAYHSEQGHTAALARAVAEGAQRVPATIVVLKRTRDVQCADLKAARAIIVGSPVYWNNMSGEAKTFFDRWTTECQVLPPEFSMKDKIGGAFVTGGEVSSGKEIALITILAAMLGNRMIVVSEGQALGAAATTGEGKQPLSKADLEDGRRLGERVARVAHAFRRGASE